MSAHTLSPRARAVVERTFIELLRARHPDFIWEVGPGEGAQGHTTSTPRKVLGSVSTQDKEGPPIDGELASAA